MNLTSDCLADLFGEAHLVADQPADLRTELRGDAARHAARGDPARLGAADHAGQAAPRGQTQLGQLCTFARAGLAREDDDLVLADRRGDVVGARRYRQLLGDADLRHAVGARGVARMRRGRAAPPVGERGRRHGIALRQAVERARQRASVTQHGLVEAGTQRLKFRMLVGCPGHDRKSGTALPRR